MCTPIHHGPTAVPTSFGESDIVHDVSTKKGGTPGDGRQNVFDTIHRNFDNFIQHPWLGKVPGFRDVGNSRTCHKNASQYNENPSKRAHEKRENIRERRRDPMSTTEEDTPRPLHCCSSMSSADPGGVAPGPEPSAEPSPAAAKPDVEAGCGSSLTRAQLQKRLQLTQLCSLVEAGPHAGCADVIHGGALLCRPLHGVRIFFF